MKRVVMLAAFFAACSSKPQPSKEPAHAEPEQPHAAQADGGDHRDESEEHEALPSRVRLSPKVIADAGIKTARVVSEALPQTVSLTGQLTSDPDRTAKIGTRVPGRITDVHAKEGDRVKAGSLLAVIESPELARARATFAASQAKASSAHQNLDRLERVAEKGLASGQEVAAARAEVETLDAEVRAARQTLAAFGTSADAGAGSRIELRSPVAGYVLERDAVRGQTVTGEHIAFVVADLDKAYFSARLFEKDLARVRVGAVAEVRLNAYPNDIFIGSVETVGRALDPTARTVIARIALKNRNDLVKVGLFGTALVTVPDEERRPARPVVPVSAVTRIADRDAVFVRQADDHFEVHQVTLGRSAGGRVEVVAGLRVGEQVVTEGVFTLKSALLKSTFGEEN